MAPLAKLEVNGTAGGVLLGPDVDMPTINITEQHLQMLQSQALAEA